MTKTTYTVNGTRYSTYAQALANAKNDTSITTHYEKIEEPHARRTPEQYAKIKNHFAEQE